MTTESKQGLSVYRMPSQFQGFEDLLVLKDPLLQSSQPLWSLAQLGFKSIINLCHLSDLGFNGHPLR